MKNTLKQRAEIFRAHSSSLFQKIRNIKGSLRISDYQFLSDSVAEQLDFAGSLIRDQQARIEEIKDISRYHLNQLNAAEKENLILRNRLANSGWKPIADMPEELKDGRYIWIKGEGYYPVSVRWNVQEQGFQSQELTWYGKDTITHYMEIIA